MNKLLKFNIYSSPKSKLVNFVNFSNPFAKYFNPSF